MILEVATVTFANGGDNIGVYVPVFATAGVGGMSVYAMEAPPDACGPITA